MSLRTELKRDLRAAVLLGLDQPGVEQVIFRYARKIGIDRIGAMKHELELTIELARKEAAQRAEGARNGAG